MMRTCPHANTLSNVLTCSVYVALKPHVLVCVFNRRGFTHAYSDISMKQPHLSAYLTDKFTIKKKKKQQHLVLIYVAQSGEKSPVQSGMETGSKVARNPRFREIILMRAENVK